MCQIKVTRVSQLPGHCGPATLAAMFGHHNIQLTQQEIGLATEIPIDLLKKSGARIDELRLAVRKLQPTFELVGKYNSTIDDIAEIISRFDIPVGVEWRGSFYKRNGNVFEAGHYSLVLGIDKLQQTMSIMDPEDNSVYVQGQIKINEFQKRWWEIDLIPQSIPSNSSRLQLNERLLFLLATKKTVTQLAGLGLQPMSLEVIQKFGHKI